MLALLAACAPSTDEGTPTTVPPEPTASTADTSSPATSATGETGTSTPGYPRCGTLDRHQVWTGAGDIAALERAPDGTLFSVGHLGPELHIDGPTSTLTLHDTCGNAMDALMVHLSADLDPLWTRTARGCGVGSPALALSADRIAWVTNRNASATFGAETSADTTVPFHGQTDVAVAAYTTSGDLLWVGDVAGEGGEYARDVALGPDGSVVLLATFGYYPIRVAPGDPGSVTLQPSLKNNPLNEDDGLLARWNADGTLAWAQKLGGPSNVYPESVDVAADGTILVSGGYDLALVLAEGTPQETRLEEFPNSPNGEGFVAAYAPGGQLLWAQRFGGIGINNDVDATVFRDDTLHAVVGSSDGDVYGDPPVAWPIGEDDWTAIARWSPGGAVSGVRGLLGLEPKVSSMDTHDGWLAIGGMAAAPFTFGAPPNTVDLFNPVEWGDPLVLTWRPDGSEACAWPIQSDDEDWYVKTDAVLFDGQGGLWATITFDQPLHVLPGTPEELNLVDTTVGYDVLLAHFLLEAPAASP